MEIGRNPKSELISQEIFQKKRSFSHTVSSVRSTKKIQKDILEKETNIEKQKTSEKNLKMSGQDGKNLYQEAMNVPTATVLSDTYHPTAPTGTFFFSTSSL